MYFRANPISRAQPRLKSRQILETRFIKLLLLALLISRLSSEHQRIDKFLVGSWHFGAVAVTAAATVVVVGGPPFADANRLWVTKPIWYTCPRTLNRGDPPIRDDQTVRTNAEKVGRGIGRRYKGPGTLRHVTAGGTTLGYHKCQKASGHKASSLSSLPLSLFFSLLPLYADDWPQFSDASLHTVRDLRRRTSTALLCIFHFGTFVRSSIYQLGDSSGEDDPFRRFRDGRAQKLKRSAGIRCPK